MVTNEQLIELYKSTNDKKNKEIIFKQLYDNLVKGAMKICHYYSNPFPKSYQSDFFEEIMQESSICLLRTIDVFRDDKNTIFSTFYYTCLKNHIKNIYKQKFKHIENEKLDDSVLDWVSSSTIKRTEVIDNDDRIDKSFLREIFNKNVEKINFSKKIHEKIFLDYIGLTEENNPNETFASLSRKYNLSRMGVKKICDKYMKQLKIILNKSGDIDKLRKFLWE